MNNPVNANKMLKSMIFKNQLDNEEQTALLSELMCCYISSGRSELMELVLKDDIAGFRALLKYMHDQGVKLTKILMETNNEKK